MNQELKPRAQHSVYFYDYIYRCRQPLGKLGITVNEEYKMTKQEMLSIASNLLDEGLAVQIMEHNGFYLITVDRNHGVFCGEVVTPFRIPKGEA